MIGSARVHVDGSGLDIRAGGIDLCQAFAVQERQCHRCADSHKAGLCSGSKDLAVAFQTGIQIQITGRFDVRLVDRGDIFHLVDSDQDHSVHGHRAGG